VPGVTGLAAEWLVKHGIKATGSDMNTLDQIVRGPNSLARPAHTILLSRVAITSLSVESGRVGRCWD
jgi:kynurenine formamidase